MTRTRYRFSHRANNQYWWYGPRVDSRVEVMICGVDWFWTKKGGENSHEANEHPTASPDQGSVSME